ncbi:hypothetical protein AB0D38_43080, partial [Streptomyces sp. NPDC048279]|uniref:hypothetical protein n=1 Tax=Streptomyces sp. NPDC048279 TaxID=3154714 RepID=UPI00341E3327
MRYRYRPEAGRELAAALVKPSDEADLPDPVVPAPPRGGAAAPLDVLVVRTIGAPHHEEFGVGAFAGDDPQLPDRATAAPLDLGEDAWPPWWNGSGANCAVVDDGPATGSTARAAPRTGPRPRPVRARRPRRRARLPGRAARRLGESRQEADKKPTRRGHGAGTDGGRGA